MDRLAPADLAAAVAPSSSSSASASAAQAQAQAVPPPPPTADGAASVCAFSSFSSFAAAAKAAAPRTSSSPAEMGGGGGGSSEPEQYATPAGTGGRSSVVDVDDAVHNAAELADAELPAAITPTPLSSGAVLPVEGCCNCTDCGGGDNVGICFWERNRRNLAAAGAAAGAGPVATSGSASASTSPPHVAAVASAPEDLSEPEETIQPRSRTGSGTALLRNLQQRLAKAKRGAMEARAAAAAAAAANGNAGAGTDAVPAGSSGAQPHHHPAHHAGDGNTPNHGSGSSKRKQFRKGRSEARRGSAAGESEPDTSAGNRSVAAVYAPLPLPTSDDPVPPATHASVINHANHLALRVQQLEQQLKQLQQQHNPHAPPMDPNSAAAALAETRAQLVAAQGRVAILEQTLIQAQRPRNELEAQFRREFSAQVRLDGLLRIQ